MGTSGDQQWSYYRNSLPSIWTSPVSVPVKQASAALRPFIQGPAAHAAGPVHARIIPTSPPQQSALHSSSLSSSNCCHRPQHIDRVPLPPPLFAPPRLRITKLRGLHESAHGAGRPCGGGRAVKAADGGFTYTVRLSPGPVGQLSGSGVKSPPTTPAASGRGLKNKSVTSMWTSK